MPFCVEGCGVAVGEDHDVALVVHLTGPELADDLGALAAPAADQYVARTLERPHACSLLDDGGHEPRGDGGGREHDEADAGDAHHPVGDEPELGPQLVRRRVLEERAERANRRRRRWSGRRRFARARRPRRRWGRRTAPRRTRRWRGAVADSHGRARAAALLLAVTTFGRRRSDRERTRVGSRRGLPCRRVRSPPVRHAGRAVPRRSGRRARRARPGRGRRRAGRGAARARSAARRRRPHARRSRSRATARALALFTIGETPWSAEQRDAILDRRARGRARGARRSTPRPTRATGGTSTARSSAPASTATRGRRRSSPTCSTRRIPRARTSGTEWRWHDEVYQFRDLRPDAQVLLRVRDGELDLDAPGRTAAVVRLPARVVLRRGRGPGVLDQPRPLPGRVGDARRTCAISRAASAGRRRSGQAEGRRLADSGRAVRA